MRIPASAVSSFGGSRVDYPNASHRRLCNPATYDFVAATDLVLFGMMPGGTDRTRHYDPSYNTLVGVAIARLELSATEVTGEVAYNLANQGRTVVAAGNGHLAPVIASDAPYDDGFGPSVSHVGAGASRIWSASSAFGGRSNVQFYYNPELDNGWIDEGQTQNSF